LEREISENKQTKKGLLNKKRLEAELIKKQDVYEKIVTNLKETKANVEKYKGEMEYTQKIQDIINNRLKRTDINLPEGDMTIIEFIDKAKELLQQVQQEQLAPENQEKNKEYEALNTRLSEIKNLWNGKQVWQNINK